MFESIFLGLVNYFQIFVGILDFPALVLLLILAGGAWVCFRIQRNQNNNFDFADMLRDVNGKPSAGRWMTFVCGAVSSWYVVYATIHNTISEFSFLGYLTVWSGAKIAERMLEMKTGVSTSNNATPPTK